MEVACVLICSATFFSSCKCKENSSCDETVEDQDHWPHNTHTHTLDTLTSGQFVHRLLCENRYRGQPRSLILLDKSRLTDDHLTSSGLTIYNTIQFYWFNAPYFAECPVGCETEQYHTLNWAITTGIRRSEASISISDDWCENWD